MSNVAYITRAQADPRRQLVELMASEKQCKTCGAVKPLTDYYRHKGRKDGLQSWCKPCQDGRARAWRDANRLRARAINNRATAKSRKLRPLSALLRSLKARAKTMGLAFTLTEADLNVPEVCPVLGIPLMMHAGEGKGVGQDNSPSVDRIDNSKGYTAENILIISNRANRLKGDSTPNELLAIAQFYGRLDEQRRAERVALIGFLAERLSPEIGIEGATAALEAAEAAGWKFFKR